VFNWYFFSFQF